MRKSTLTNCLLFIFLFSINIGKAQWMPTTGPGGGEVISMVTKGTDIFAATFGGGIFLSSDSGSSWKAVNSGLTFGYITALAINGSILFAGTYDHGVFISNDNGANWIFKGLSGMYISSFAFSGSKIFAATYGQGVFLSNDNGDSWNAFNSGLSNKNVTALASIGMNIFAAIYGIGIYSSASGSDWVYKYSYPDCGMLATNGTKLYAGHYSGTFSSNDSGSTWSVVHDKDSLGISGGSLAVNGNIMCIGAVDGTGKVSISTDNGITWSSSNTGLFTEIESVSILGNILVAGTKHYGIIISADSGVTWKSSNTGLSASSLYDLLVSHDRIFASTITNHLFSSDDIGANWSLSYNVDYFTSLATDGVNIFAGSYNGNIILSHDNGTTWISKTKISYLSISSFAFSGNNIFAGVNGKGVFLTTDPGSTWTAVNSGLTSKHTSSMVIVGDNIIAGDDSLGIFISSDSGSHWYHAPLSSRVEALTVMGAIIYAGTFGSGVFMSADTGKSWLAVNNGLPDLYIGALAVNGANIFVATTRDVLLSRDSGANWSTINTGLLNTNVNCFAFNATDIFVGTSGAGVWKRSLSEILAEPEYSNNNTILIYPNPAKSDITIHRQDYINKMVSVSIINLQGQKLIQSEIKNRASDIKLDISKLTSGIYFICITSEDGHFVKKIVKQ